MGVKQHLFNHLKNIGGWRTRRKLLIISVDDYGNVRLASKQALQNLEAQGNRPYSRFDALDTLETREDLTELYKVLDSVRDAQSRPACFTPYALSANIDFERMAAEDYQSFYWHSVPETFAQRAAEDTAYEGAWQEWQEGMERGLMAPQFHGTVHLQERIFKNLLFQRDPDLICSLANKSYVELAAHAQFRQPWPATYALEENGDGDDFIAAILAGLDLFEEVYGYRAVAFTPPAMRFPERLEPQLWQQTDLKAIDKPFKLGRTALAVDRDKITLVRNVVFEPTEARGINWVAHALKQVEAAFRMGKPAHISSHRVNFCGHIDPANREKGLAALQSLLQAIVRCWPEVEFISVDNLVKIIK